jgi:hypothetical protein
MAPGNGNANSRATRLIATALVPRHLLLSTHPGQRLLSGDAEPEVRDAGLIAAAQRVERYEMAGYGCVRIYAKLLGYKSAEKTLQQTLNEEGAADKKLTQLAERTTSKPKRLQNAPPRQNAAPKNLLPKKSWKPSA